MSVIPLTTPAARPSLFGLKRVTLAESLAGQGCPRYRADQIYGWSYQKHHRSAEGMSNLPGALKHSLDEGYDLALPRVAAVHATRDQLTRKFLLELEDGARVECVSMRTERRLTFCLS